MTKYIIAALLAVCALVGGFSWYEYRALSTLRAKNAEQERIIKASEAQINRLTRTASVYAKARDAAEARNKESTRATTQIIKDNAAWADQPLPAGVVEWLRQSDSAVEPSP